MDYGINETCCFTGHRSGKLPWGDNENDARCTALKRRLYDVLEGLSSSGVRRYICGMAQGSDMYFAEAVLALRRERPQVVLEAAVPCLGQESSWPEMLRERYRRILESADIKTVLSHRYTPSCMEERNRYMVENSGVVVAVFGGGRGGTFNTLRMAYRLGRRVIELDV